MLIMTKKNVEILLFQFLQRTTESVSHFINNQWMNLSHSCTKINFLEQPYLTVKFLSNNLPAVQKRWKKTANGHLQYTYESTNMKKFQCVYTLKT